MCEAQLFAAELEGFNLAGCGACGGVWLTHGAASRVMSGRVLQASRLADQLAGKTKPNPALLAQRAHCPECRTELARVHTVGVEIDVCAEHGTWFDRGELDRLMDAVAPPAPKPTLSVGIPLDSSQTYRWLALFAQVCKVFAVIVVVMGVATLIASCDTDKDPPLLDMVWIVVSTAFGFLGLMASENAARALLELLNRPYVR